MSLLILLLIVVVAQGTGELFIIIRISSGFAIKILIIFLKRIRERD